MRERAELGASNDILGKMNRMNKKSSIETECVHYEFIMKHVLIAL